MVTCEQCGTEFTAHGVQSYPGGTDPPASHLAYAIILGLSGLLLGIAGLFVFRLFMFGLAIACVAGALSSLAAIPGARRICERAEGGICPSCGHKNPVRWCS
jgi:hypothetical protein